MSFGICSSWPPTNSEKFQTWPYYALINDFSSSKSLLFTGPFLSESYIWIMPCNMLATSDRVKPRFMSSWRCESVSLWLYLPSTYASMMHSACFLKNSVWFSNQTVHKLNEYNDLVCFVVHCKLAIYLQRKDWSFLSIRTAMKIIQCDYRRGQTYFCSVLPNEIATQKPAI